MSLTRKHLRSAAQSALGPFALLFTLCVFFGNFPFPAFPVSGKFQPQLQPNADTLFQQRTPNVNRRSTRMRGVDGHGVHRTQLEAPSVAHGTGSTLGKATSMTTWYSSELGWTAGQDVSSEFAALVENEFKPGDTFVFDDMYRIKGGDFHLPENFTLTATAGGGLDVLDTATNSKPLFVLSDGNTIDNVTIICSNAPNTGTEEISIEKGVDFHAKTLIEINNADDVTVVNSAFIGNINMHLDVGNSDNLTVENTLFEGGHYQVRLHGGSDDATFLRTHFKDSLGDGIKTMDIGGVGPQRVEIRDSFFESPNRDGIDTTGGFKDGLVSNTVFYDCQVSAMDIKMPLAQKEDLNVARQNSNILVEDSHITDCRNGFVTTVNDHIGLFTVENADSLAPHNIRVTNTTFENTDGGDMRAFHIKDGHSITWDEITFLGNIQELRLLNLSAPDGWSAYDVGGTIVNYGASDGTGKLWQYTAGPVISDTYNGQKDADDDQVPVEDSNDPIEPSDPTPGSSDGETDDGQDDASTGDLIGSQYLDIYAAFTDTGETALLSGGTGKLDLSEFAGREFTLVAVAKDGVSPIGSVKLKLEGIESRVENVAPYALFGDSKGEYFDGEEIGHGKFPVEISVYSEKGGKGEALETISFELELGTATPEDRGTTGGETGLAEDGSEQSSQTSDQFDDQAVEAANEASEEPQSDGPVDDQGSLSGDNSIMDVFATFTDTGEAILLSTAQNELNLADFVGRQLTFVAMTKDDTSGVGSVRLELDDAFSRLENVEPYALFGDRDGTLFDGERLSTGEYSLDLTVFSASKGKGEILESREFSFLVTDEPGDDDSALLPKFRFDSETEAFVELETQTQDWEAALL
jgi:hypothetical protein